MLHRTMALHPVASWAIALFLAAVAAQNCYYRESNWIEALTSMVPANKLQLMATSALGRLANRRALPTEYAVL